LALSKVILKGHIIVADSDLIIMQRELVRHIELTKQEPGCLVFDVDQDKKHANKFDVYEEFVDKTAFEAHQSRVANSEWGAVTSNVERHYQIVGID